MTYFPPLVSNDPITFSEGVVLATYGDQVSVAAKGKSLNKFGRNLSVGTAYETVAEFQGTTANETFVTTNIVDSMSSDNAADTSRTLSVEGQTTDGSGNLTFVIQDATTNASDGRTKVALTTPLMRCTRVRIKNSGTFGSPQSVGAGNIYIYDDTDGITAGVPNTAAATKIILSAGQTSSEKAATAISQNDYWFIEYFTAGIGNAGGSASYVTARMEIRDIPNGGQWIPLGREVVLIPDQTGRTLDFSAAPLIVPKSHDFRIRAKCDANSAEVYAEAGGPLAAVQG